MAYGEDVVVLQNLIYGNSAGCGGGALAFQGDSGPSGFSILIANNTIVDNIGQADAGYSECVAIFALIALAMGTAFTGCSGHYPSHTPPGTYNVIITGKGLNTGVTHTASMTLIVTE